LNGVDILDKTVEAALDHDTVASRAVVVGDKPAPDNTAVRPKHRDVVLGPGGRTIFGREVLQNRVGRPIELHILSARHRTTSVMELEEAQARVLAAHGVDVARAPGRFDAGDNRARTALEIHVVALLTWSDSREGSADV